MSGQIRAVAFVLALFAQQSVTAAPLGDRRFDDRLAAAKAAMMISPQNALDQAKAAERIAAADPHGPQGDVKRATAGWLKGEALFRLNRVNDATPVTQAALQLAERAAPRSKLVADLYRSQGNMLASVAQIEPAFRDFQRAHLIYRTIDDRRGQAMALQDIGSLYSDANDNTRVLYYYDQSADAYSGDPRLMLSADNNRAEALKKLGRFKEAWPQYRAALGLANKLGSASLNARILSNLADAQVVSGDLAAAGATVDRGLALATKDAAEWRPFLFGVKARIDLQRGNLASAAQWIALTFDGADLTKTPVTYRDFHEVAYHIYLDLQDYPKALAHLQAFKRLDDQTRALTASTSAALVAANFDFANQNLRIGQLKAGQVLRDAKIAQANARINSLVLGSALAVGGILLVMLTVGFFSIRRSRDEVRAANESLSETNTALQSALAAKTQFLATTSHEIRTPLNGILGMTEVILSQADLDRALRERLDLVYSAGKTMRALVDDILDVAKMENGHITLEHGDIALPQLLEDVGHLWEPQALAKGVTVSVEVADCPPTMLGDEARLRQIVFNLMSNAIKFTQAGTVCLTAALSDDDAPRLLVTVRDSGIGIPQDKLNQIFEAFSQVDGGTTRQFGGTGLGLAIVRNLARAMGGDISVSSELGKGSLFTLTLPFERRAAVAVVTSDAGSAELHSHVELARSRVLYVERNPLTQGLLAAILEPRLRQLVFVSNGEEAIQRLSAGQFDQLAIDLASIDQSAVEATVAGICDKADGAPVTLLVGDVPPDVLARLSQLRIARVLTKPVSMQKLVATLTEVHEAQQNLHIRDVGQRRDAA